MNLTQAEAIASLYQELIESIDKSRIDIPSTHYGAFTKENIQDISIEDGQLKITWSRYQGCGDYDERTTYQALHTVFY